MASVAAEAILNIVRRSGAPMKTVELPTLAPSPGTRWSSAVLEGAWRAALARHTTPFSLASQTSLDDWGLLGFLLRTAPTTEAAVRAAVDRLALITDRGTWRLDDDGVATWCAAAPHCDEDHAAVLSTLAHFVVCSRQLAGPDAVREVALRDKSFGAARWFGALQIPVRYGASTEAIVFGDLRGRPSHAHPALFAHLCAEADQRIAALPAPTHRARAEEHVRRMLPDVDASRVARALGLGERTMRRRLAEEGVAFTSIVDAVRRREAEAMLARGAEIADVSADLGFSDPSAFARAFRRWTGRSPKRARRTR